MEDLDKYKEKSYWDERYRSEESFDWFCDLSALDIYQYLKPTDKILVLGCGNSALSSSLYNRGYCHIDNIDFSSVVIDRMRTKNVSLAGMSWHVMDMLDLKFGDKLFDVVLDKGSIDSLLVDQKDVWNPQQEVRERVEKALSEAFRVLKTGGHFISITFSQPHFRGKLLCQPDKFCWSVHHTSFGTTFHYFTYIAVKHWSTEEVVSNQTVDYTFPTLYSSNGEHRTEMSMGCDRESDFLFNIGDVYENEL